MERKRKSMTKRDIGIKLAKKHDLNIAEAVLLSNTFFEIIAEGILANKEIECRGFLSLRHVARKAKKARNIAAGTELLLPAYKDIKCVVAKEFKKQLNKK